MGLKEKRNYRSVQKNPPGGKRPLSTMMKSPLTSDAVKTFLILLTFRTENRGIILVQNQSEID